MSLRPQHFSQSQVKTASRRLLLLGSLSLLLLTSCSVQSGGSSASSAGSSAGAPATTVASGAPSATPSYFAEKGIAIRGADPVAYFTEGTYVPGSAEFTQEWNGVTWQFATAEHRDQFASNPEAYAPQYGGFCAWAVSQGYTAEVDPTAWKIVDGKLYLNYDNNIQQKWAKDIAGNIAKANQNWPGVLNQS